MMNQFENLHQLQSDFTAIVDAFKMHLANAADLNTEVENRLKAEKLDIQTKIAEMQKTAADETRSRTVRDLSNLKIKDLKEKKFSPTDEEKAAFNREIEAAKTAVSDLRKICESARVAISEATSKVSRIKSEILGDSAKDLRERWIESEIQKFLSFETGEES